MGGQVDGWDDGLAGDRLRSLSLRSNRSAVAGVLVVRAGGARAAWE